MPKSTGVATTLHHCHPTSQLRTVSTSRLFVSTWPLECWTKAQKSFHTLSLSRYLLLFMFSTVFFCFVVFFPSICFSHDLFPRLSIFVSHVCCSGCFIVYSSCFSCVSLFFFFPLCIPTVFQCFSCVPFCSSFWFIFSPSFFMCVLVFLLLHFCLCYPSFLSFLCFIFVSFVSSLPSYFLLRSLCGVFSLYLSLLVSADRFEGALGLLAVSRGSLLVASLSENRMLVAQSLRERRARTNCISTGHVVGFLQTQCAGLSLCDDTAAARSPRATLRRDAATAFWCRWSSFVLTCARRDSWSGHA